MNTQPHAPTASATEAEDRLDGLVDLARYPIHDLDASPARTLLRHCHDELREDGCVVLRDFLASPACEAVQQESQQLSPATAYTHREVNAYFTDDDPTLPADDPRRFFMQRTSGFVPRDRFPTDSLLRRLYEAPVMQRFLAACFQMPALYDYADPLAGLTLNVVPPGAEFPWHYDTNHVAVTLMTQDSEAGGVFEYAPGIRTTSDENLDGVARVLRGEDRESVRSLELRPGDLQLFLGRYSLHRVSPVRGERERHVAVLAYCEEPGMIGRMARTEQLFGRVTDAHVAAQAAPRRNDTLVD